tara:strand:- start:460 stop:675 length:216 start_codon:yes stop_codon:yes gene_type:complete
MPNIIKKKKKKKNTVNYSMPYEGSIGMSVNREIAKKIWSSSADANEQKLGYILTRDADGKYIARTKLESKA